VAGRFLGEINLKVPGWTPGTARDFEVAGWSQALGATFNPAWLTTTLPWGTFFGISSVGTGVAGGFDGIGTWPTATIFGGTTGIRANSPSQPLPATVTKKPISVIGGPESTDYSPLVLTALSAPPAPRASDISSREEPLRATRREFLRKTALLAGAAGLPGCATSKVSTATVIDIHQHLNYSGRADDALLAHQRAMGVSKTVLLPAGREMNLPSTHNGTTNGLEAECAGNEACYRFAQAHPQAYAFGANEVPDAPEATKEIEKYLKLGAVIIAEQKFALECDSPEMQRIYRLAADYRVPVLMHWQYQRYNFGFERFHKMLARYPKTNFIGHAQTWWAHIDKNYRDDTSNLYPKGPVTPGGLTDRYLSDYPNMFGDLSAGSGLNAFTRDEDHTRAFLERHQDKLLYGSDCNDSAGAGDPCQGAQTLAVLRRLAPSQTALQKLLNGNARRLLKV
jgi:predicted TIM-barrel fold metal-dependent hydrolase